MENTGFKKLLFKRRLFAILCLTGSSAFFLGTILTVALDSKAQAPMLDTVFFWGVIAGGIIAIVSLVFHMNYMFDYKYRYKASDELNCTDICAFNFKVMRRATELRCADLPQK